VTWTSSNRRDRLPRDWHRRRAIAKREAGGICQAVTNGVRCTALGTDCDHVDRHGGDEPTNLQWLCSAHHKVKTRAEAQAAVLPRQRPAVRHPGLR
jgi:5-methylcytosine-specific restriction protein A